jgi:hypothetical protein
MATRSAQSLSVSEILLGQKTTAIYPHTLHDVTIPDRTPRPRADGENMTNDDATQHEWYSWWRTSDFASDYNTDEAEREKPHIVDYSTTVNGQLMWLEYVIRCPTCDATKGYRLQVRFRGSARLRPIAFAVCPQEHELVDHPLIYPQIVLAVIMWGNAAPPRAAGIHSARRLVAAPCRAVYPGDGRRPSCSDHLPTVDAGYRTRRTGRAVVRAGPHRIYHRYLGQVRGRGTTSHQRILSRS